MSLYSLIYISVACDKNISSDELNNILTVARERNKENQITGMLLFRDGFFVQVLEGQKEKVMSTFESIQRDNRHYDITVISENPILEREFFNWSMGFHIIDDTTIQSIDGFEATIKEAGFNNSLSQEPYYAIKLMEYFSKI